MVSKKLFESNYITLLRLSQKINLSMMNSMGYTYEITGNYLLLDLSLMGSLHFFQEIKKIEKLKLFW